MRTRKIAIFIFLAATFAAAQTLLAQSQFKFKQVIQSGDSAPVPPQLGSILDFSFNDQAQIAVIADGGLILKSGDTVVPIAGPGDAAPGGGAFFTFTHPSVGP